jgi:hypothetical protein
MAARDSGVRHKRENLPRRRETRCLPIAARIERRRAQDVYAPATLVLTLATPMFGAGYVVGPARVGNQSEHEPRVMPTAERDGYAIDALMLCRSTPHVCEQISLRKTAQASRSDRRKSRRTSATSLFLR